MNGWQWLLIAVAGAVLLCCAFGLILGSLNPGAFANLEATDTPAPPTATPAPTFTPAPTATPIPGVGDHLALGTNYGTDANGNFYITHPADRFSSRSEFAMVMTLDKGIGATQFKLLFVRVEAGGSESVVFSHTSDVPDPSYDQFANKFPIIDVLGGEPAGKYKVEIETNTAVLASATFTYTG